MKEVIARRRAELEQLRQLARAYVEALSERIPVRAAAIAGSVARGDFNVWSDVDVVVVSDALPERIPDRALLLAHDRPDRVEPIGYTTAELERAYRRGDPLVREAADAGVILRGEDLFARLGARGGS